MTVLTVAEEVAKTVGIDIPDVVLSSADRQVKELLSVMYWVTNRIVEGHDWQTLKALETITGDGSTTAWALPTYYKRMTKKAKLWTSSLETPLTHIVSEDEWLELETRSFDYVINAWTMYGDQIHIKPVLDTGVTVQYFYIDRRLWENLEGSRSLEPSTDNDFFVVDDELLTLGTIYRWKQLKKQPYDEEMRDYFEALDRKVTHDGGAKTIKIGRPRMLSGTRPAYPYRLDF